MAIKVNADGVAESNRRGWESDLSQVVVWGEGYPHAGLMFIGKRPGKWEAVNGRPFSGPVGREFDYYLGHAGIVRQQCWVTNLVKTYRDYAKPTPEEIEEWMPILHREISNVGPRTIALLGSYALSGVMGAHWPEKKLSDCHGRAWRLPESGTVIVPCYHPACSIYDQTEGYRDKLEYDFRMVRAAHEGRTGDLVDYDGLGPDAKKEVVGIRVVGSQIAPGSEGTIPQAKLF
jgi:uracil-DNA glycosylase family 4